MAISNQSARIEMTTDEAVEIELENIGEDDATPTVIQRPDRTPKHSIPLTNLEAGQQYTYALTLQDADGNTTRRTGLSFRTLAAPDNDSPVIVAGPVVSTRLEDQIVIEWVSDELADSEVQFGPTIAYGSSVSTMEDVSEHALRLTNLEAGQSYHYRVCSTDPNENPATCSSDFTFTTLDAADVDPPQILTGPTASGITDRSATLRLSSDEVGTLRITYGTSSDLADARTVNQTDPALSHAAVLTNLLPGLTYYYQVQLTDVSGNISSATGTFASLLLADEDPPIILSGPVAVAISDQGVRIELTTDEDVEIELENIGEDDATPTVVQRPERTPKHSIPLTNLEAGQQYTYALTLQDADGN
ncbi:MAG: hypothetical protein QF507_08460, partial [Vicinamibacterales bacterium]|nr:hypothetical protein [Vicinamibacterales bacterium]